MVSEKRESFHNGLPLQWVTGDGKTFAMVKESTRLAKNLEKILVGGRRLKRIESGIMAMIAYMPWFIYKAGQFFIFAGKAEYKAKGFGMFF